MHKGSSLDNLWIITNTDKHNMYLIILCDIGQAWPWGPFDCWMLVPSLAGSHLTTDAWLVMVGIY